MTVVHVKSFQNASRISFLSHTNCAVVVMCEVDAKESFDRTETAESEEVIERIRCLLNFPFFRSNDENIVNIDNKNDVVSFVDIHAFVDFGGRSEAYEFSFAGEFLMPEEW